MKGRSRSTRLFLLALFLLFSLCCGYGCRPHEASEERDFCLIYRVKVPSEEGGPVRVVVEGTRVPAGKIALFSPSSTSRMGIQDVSLSSVLGEPLEYGEHEDFDSERDDRGHLIRRKFRRWTLSLREDRTFRFSYSLLPPRSEGRATFGYLEGGLFLSSGNLLFVVPSKDLFQIAGLGVYFDLPEGWRVAGPWREERGCYRPHGPEGYAWENFLKSPIGLGRFVSREVPGGLRLWFPEKGLPQEDLVSRSEAIGRYFQGVFGEIPPIPFHFFFMPRPAKFKEIIIEPWLTGWGSVMEEPTTLQWEKFSREVFLRWQRFPPRDRILERMEAFHQGEVWFFKGLSFFFGIKGALESGRSPAIEEKRWERLRREYEIGSLGESVPPVQYRQARSEAWILWVCIPSILRWMEERAVREEGSLLERKVSSFYKTPGEMKGTIEDLLENELSGQDLNSLVEWVTQGKPPFEVSPDFPSPKGSSEGCEVLEVFVTSLSDCRLEPCGCAQEQRGGLSKRAAFLKKEREKGRSFLLIDAGEAFPNMDPMDFGELEKGETEVFLTSMEEMGYQALVLGPNAFYAKRSFLLEWEKRLPFPLLSANVLDRSRSEPVCKPFEKMRVGKHKVCLLGMTGIPLFRHYFERVEEALLLNRLYLQSPVQALKRVLPAATSEEDALVFLAGQLSPQECRWIAQNFSIHVILSTDSFLWKPDEDEVLVKGEILFQIPRDRSGFVHNTLLLYPRAGDQGLDRYMLYIDSKGRIKGFSEESVLLGEDFPEDPSVRASLDRFYGSFEGKPMEPKGSPFPFFWEELERDEENCYVGSRRCGECHEKEAERWGKTAHARAYQTLVKKKRNFYPRCLPCHLTGYGHPGGFQGVKKSLELLEVGCEVCHGPGGKHIAEAEENGRGAIRKEIGRKHCTACHTPQRSPLFGEQYERFVREGKH